MTGFAFNTKEIFTSFGFWALSTMYWILWTIMIGMIVEGVK